WRDAGEQFEEKRDEAPNPVGGECIGQPALIAPRRGRCLCHDVPDDLDQMMPPPSIRRMMPMTMTTMFRLRPEVLVDIAPSARPTTAKGTITQFAQPRSGMKAKTARTSAMAPMTSEAIFSMGELSHAARHAARPFRFVDAYTRFVLLPQVHATGRGPG